MTSENKKKIEKKVEKTENLKRYLDDLSVEQAHLHGRGLDASEERGLLTSKFFFYFVSSKLDWIIEVFDHSGRV